MHSSLLNRIAISFLTALSSLLQVDSLPQQQNGWQVVHPWAEHSGVYEAMLESTKVVEDCIKAPSSFISFPTIIHGAHEIYLDGRKISTFGDPSFNKVRSFFGSPVLSCSEVKAGGVLTWKAFSYAFYFARIYSYPQITKSSPIRDLFGETLNVIASGALALLSVLVLLLSVKKLPLHQVLSFSASIFLFASYFFWSTPSFFSLEVSMLVAHKLADCSVWLGLFFFANTLYHLGTVPRATRSGCLGVVCLVLIIILLGKNGDEIQFGTSLPFVLIPLTLLYSFASQVRRLTWDNWGSESLKVIGLAFWFGSIMNDMFVITGLSGGYMMMSIGSIGGFLFFATGLNDQIIGAYKERDHLRTNLEKEVERKTKQLNDQTLELEQANSDLKASQHELFTITSQIAHDIRSPLAALRVISQELKELPEKTRTILRSAIDRVNDIANTLAYRNFEKKRERGSGSDIRTSVVSLAHLIDKVLTEKRVQYRHRLDVDLQVEMSQDFHGLFVLASEVELERAISNLINNAVEAISGRGRIHVHAEKTDEFARVVIQDNGRGVPAQQLDKLGTRGFTFGKDHGTGLGLYHARKQIEERGGSLKIESDVDRGTRVIVSLPLATPPPWFVSSISIYGVSRIVFLDDDINIHQVWEQKFAPVQSSHSALSLIHFSQPDDFEKWIQAHGSGDGILYLLDQEFFGSAKTGLELIHKFQLFQKAVLVTSRYDDEICFQCQQAGVKLLPKSMAGLIPIV